MRTRKRVTATILLLTVLPLLSGCGTLLNKGVNTAPVTSSPDGANIYVDGNRVGTTPDTVSLDNQKSHTIALRMDGYRESTCQIRSSAKAGWVVLDVVFGVAPLVVDAVTGGWKGISNPACHVDLQEASAASQDATNLQW